MVLTAPGLQCPRLGLVRAVREERLRSWWLLRRRTWAMDPVENL